MTNFIELLRPHVQTQPDFPVLTFDSHGEAPDEIRTYQQLWDNGHALAAKLTEFNVKPRTRFALLMANHPEFVEAMVASSLIGSVFMPIDPRAQGDKLAFMLNSTDCEGVIVADYARANLDAIRDKLPKLKWVLELGEEYAEALDIQRAVKDRPYEANVADAENFVGEAHRGFLRAHTVVRPYAMNSDTSVASVGAVFDRPQASPQEAMQLIFTSGTTGDPKAIVMTQARFCGTANMAAQAFGYQQDDVLYSGLSLTHANAQLVTLGAALAKGIRAVFSRRFSRSKLWDVCRKHGCTSFSLLGGMTVAVFAQPERANDRDHQVKKVIAAGMPASIWNDFRNRFGVEITEFYGMAEGSLTVNPAGVGPAGSIGKPAPSLNYRIVNQFEQDCAIGEPGELWFSSSTEQPLSVEYLNNPDASVKRCCNGWLKTGDIVSQDEHGWLFFHHRDGSSIRRNGEFISPTTLERVIAEHPDVDDLYVYGKPAASGVPGEKDLIIAVVPRTQNFDPQSIFSLCQEKLEKHYLPDYVQVVDELPKTASEKPQERFLLEMFEDGRSALFSLEARAERLARA